MQIDQDWEISVARCRTVCSRAQEDSKIERSIPVGIDEYLLIGTMKVRRRGVAKAFNAKRDNRVGLVAIHRVIARYAYEPDDVRIGRRRRRGRLSGKLQLERLDQAENVKPLAQIRPSVNGVAGKIQVESAGRQRGIYFVCWSARVHRGNWLGRCIERNSQCRRTIGRREHSISAGFSQPLAA